MNDKYDLAFTKPRPQYRGELAAMDKSSLVDRAFDNSVEAFGLYRELERAQKLIDDLVAERDDWKSRFEDSEEYIDDLLSGNP